MYLIVGFRLVSHAEPNSEMEDVRLADTELSKKRRWSWLPSPILGEAQIKTLRLLSSLQGDLLVAP